MHEHDKFSDYYINHILDDWKDREEPNPAEIYLLNTYLTNTKNKVLEAGTGGGLLSFYLEELGFNKIDSFDIIPEMISKAKEQSRLRNSTISFKVTDASDLKIYPDNSFDYMIYLQQILCMVPRKKFQNALDEANRVCKNDGILICSFMDWDSRWFNWFVCIAINTYRFLSGRELSKYYIPQLRWGGQLNYKFFSGEERAIFWPTLNYIKRKLEKTGFHVESYYREEELTNIKGTAFYLVCRKKEKLN